MADVSRKLQSYREAVRCFYKYVLPYLGAKPASEGTRGDVIEVLDRLNKAGRAAQANRVQAYVRRTFMRPGQAAGLAFGDVDQDENNSPSEDTESGRTHTNRANLPVMAIIKRRRKASYQDELHKWSGQWERHLGGFDKTNEAAQAEAA